MAPNISLREYIRWLPDVANEPTTTIVLTSVENRFVDIRVLKSTTELREDRATGDVLHTSRLDWAFAGISTSEFRTGSDGTAIVHSTWHHWVDSRTGNAEGVTDEGDMYPQPDGTTLELGTMINPATGHMTQYEECWKDVEPTTTDDDDNKGKKICVVLQLHDDEHKARGMVVRVGQFCQGVLRVGDHFSLERWKWTKGSGWKREARIGDLWIPCGSILEGERLRPGGEMQYGEYSWRVVEMSEF